VDCLLVTTLVQMDNDPLHIGEPFNESKMQHVEEPPVPALVVDLLRARGSSLRVLRSAGVLAWTWALHKETRNILLQHGVVAALVEVAGRLVGSCISLHSQLHPLSSGPAAGAEGSLQSAKECGSGNEGLEKESDVLAVCLGGLGVLMVDKIARQQFLATQNKRPSFMDKLLELAKLRFSSEVDPLGFANNHSSRLDADEKPNMSDGTDVIASLDESRSSGQAGFVSKLDDGPYSSSKVIQAQDASSPSCRTHPHSCQVSDIPVWCSRLPIPAEKGDAMRFTASRPAKVPYRSLQVAQEPNHA
jgi:hypothetical protein